MREEWIGNQIDNPHVLKTYLHHSKRTFLYQVTEYIECKTLRALMHDNPNTSIDDMRDIIEQIAAGLQAFHRLEMIHRDLKPENIIIDRYGVVKIIDFGSVKISGDEESLLPYDKTNLVGTVDYTAPEFLSGATGSERSDQYSLGVIAYEMLSGKLPFRKPAVEHSTRPRSYIPLNTHGVDVPVWVEGAIKKTLNPDPEKRYEVISEFVYDLSHANSEFVAQGFQPLIERNPLKFWKVVATLSLVFNLILALVILKS